MKFGAILQNGRVKFTAGDYVAINSSLTAFIKTVFSLEPYNTHSAVKVMQKSSSQL
jgi:hypothetical protein